MIESIARHVVGKKSSALSILTRQCQIPGKEMQQKNVRPQQYSCSTKYRTYFFLLKKRENLREILNWLVGCTDAAAARRRGATETMSETTAFKEASVACHCKGRSSTVARALLAQERARETVETLDRVRSQFGENNAAFVAAAAAAAAAGATSWTALALGGETVPGYPRPHNNRQGDQIPRCVIGGGQRRSVLTLPLEYLSTALLARRDSGTASALSGDAQ